MPSAKPSPHVFPRLSFPTCHTSALVSKQTGGSLSQMEASHFSSERLLIYRVHHRAFNKLSKLEEQTFLILVSVACSKIAALCKSSTWVMVAQEGGVGLVTTGLLVQTPPRILILATANLCISSSSVSVQKVF